MIGLMIEYWIVRTMADTWSAEASESTRTEVMERRT